MRLIRHCASAAALALLTTAFALPADAQTIRSYGDDGSSGQSSGSSGSNSGSSKAWYPGMPQPQTSSGGGEQQAAAQPSGEEGGEEAAEGIGPSHRITVFSGKKAGANAPRTTLDLALDQLYRGVIPGTRDDVAHLARARKAAQKSGTNQLTWLGFHPTDDKTRVFFQTAQNADYRVERKKQDNQIVVKLRNTKLSARNFARFIDTSYFERNVKRVETKKTGSDAVEIIIDLASFEQPTVRRDGTYVYLDFPYDASKDSQRNEQMAGSPDAQ